MELSADVESFFKKFKYVPVATLDIENKIHISIKGIIDIKNDGRIYLLDSYKGKTYRNIRKNSQATIFAVDEHNFQGYALQSKAYIIDIKEVDEEIFRKWEENITRRISERVIKNIQKERPSSKHPEIEFPYPKHMILIEPEQIIDLAPQRRIKE